MKPWLAPDIAESIRSGVPKPWLAPDLAQAIRSGISTPWLPQDVADDVADAAGSTPDWVPTDAKIYIDLVGDRAWTEADGEVAINTLLGTDANTLSAGWDVTEYDAVNFTEHGYQGENPVAFIGLAQTKVLDEATVRFQWIIVTGGGSNTEVDIALLATGSDGVRASAFTATGALEAKSFNGTLDNAIASIVNTNAGAKNSIAVTVTATRFDVAMNGSSAVAGVLGETDRPSDNPFVSALVDTGNSFNALQSITIYDALPSTAGLSALSETGVTNTAPHDVTFDGWDDIGSSFAGGVVVQGDTHGITSALFTASATDDEGNPLTWSVTADDTGYITVTDPGNIITYDNAGPTPLDISTYNFTIRATDPGGLYVEQEFTITVTA